MDTRDQWYKPNLLYNIHYRPPKKPDPPKMIVETVQFNPSVCTCGEHGCQPQYRMEKRVLWTDKEACIDKQRSKVKEKDNKDEHGDNKFQKSITMQDRKICSVTESKQIGMKKEVSQEHRYIESEEGKQGRFKEKTGQKCHLEEVDGRKQMELKEKIYQECRFKKDNNKFGTAERFQEKMSGDVKVRSGCKAYGIVNEEDDDIAEEKEQKKKEYCDFKNEVGCSESKDGVCIDEEVSKTNKIKENNSNGRSNRDNSQGRNSEEVYEEMITGNDTESVVGNDCDSEEKCSKDGLIDKDNKTGEDDGRDDSDGAEDDTEYWSESMILINDSDGTAEYSVDSENGDLDNVEIASAFGILTIYCNSELHNWRSFIDEVA